MGEMASLWAYEENNDMEQLGQKLLYTTLELENLKAEARDQMMRNNEYVKQLFHLLKLAIQERDEARIQLQKLPTKAIPLADHLPILPFYQSDSPAVKPGKANSSITESGSFSSPVDSLFDGVSSPEFSNINLVGTHHFVQDCNAHSVLVPKIDEGTLVIDNIAKGRVLPQKGKLLQAVLEAGPLLQTLLLAGPLPRWRNPPQLQPFQIDPVSIKSCGDSDMFAQKPASRLVDTQQHYAAQSGPILKFGNAAASGTCLSTGSMIVAAVNANGFTPLLKRQRFC